MTQLNVAIIGVGYLGKFHLQKYAQLDGINVAAVCDVDKARTDELAQEFNCQAVYDFRDLADSVDAVSIVVPTPLHHEVAQFFLEHNTHVLIEKPITTTLEEADELIALAAERDLVLQVGHLERFNPALLALKDQLDTPRFIESIRVAPFQLRGSDVNVVLDLMIHDIDIIQSLVDSPLKHIHAVGAPVLSGQNDIINARLEFENQCVANVTASRISFKKERKLRVFQHDAYFSVDLQNKEMAMFRKGEGEMFPGVPEITGDRSSFPESDALFDEVKAFIAAIHNGSTPLVTGQDGRRALETALKISAEVDARIGSLQVAS